MANYEFTSPDGKKYTITGPEGSTKEQAFGILQNQLSSANKAKQSQLSDQIPSSSGSEERIAAGRMNINQEDTTLGKIIGAAYETPLTIGSNMIGGTLGHIAGTAKYLTGSTWKDSEETANKIASAIGYQPKSETAKYLVNKIGSGIESSGIQGLPIPELNNLVRLIGPSSALRGAAGTNALATQSAENASLVNTPMREFMGSKPKNALSGVGAADTGNALIRTERAADLPIPINLTKGQKNRTFEQQQFEAETAKLPEGEPLRQRKADQNQQFLQNIDSFIDTTGAQQPTLRATGKVVTDALINKATESKAKINEAYRVAKESGSMEEPVPVQAISDYIEKNRSAMKNAPILSSVEDELKRLDNGTGKISINDIEELRKMTGRLSQPGTPNSVYGGDVKSLIDEATKDKGGVEYQQARRMYENYSSEFKNAGVIDKLLRTKPGTKDRSVAYEDVTNHSIFDGSLDDVRNIRRTLQTAGDDGSQAWKELQGQTLNQLKESITSNTSRDIRGNPIVSPAKFNKMVNNLDSDGKLDFVFGKQGAQKLRDMNELSMDIFTAPPGSVNSSNTSSALMRGFESLAGYGKKIPVVGHAIDYGIKKSKSNKLQQRVLDALDE